MPRPSSFKSNYHARLLKYNTTKRARQAAIYAAVPSIVDIFLNCLAAIPKVAKQAKALVANYGATGNAFLNIVFSFDRYALQGKLPFNLLRSMEAVEASREDVPFDTKNPVFRFGHGLSY